MAEGSGTQTGAVQGIRGAWLRADGFTFEGRHDLGFRVYTYSHN